MGFIVTRAFRAGVVVCMVVTCAAASDAWAQSPSELDRGRNLFRQALSMEVAGDWAGALSRLDAVSRIKTTPQVRFHLARCKEHLGRLTEALGDYRMAEYEAARLNVAELGDISRARQDLEVRVPKLVVTLSPSLNNSTVELDGIVLGVSGFGQEIPVDPGEHQFVVNTPDGQSFVRRIRVSETSVERVQIDAPPGFVQRTPGINRRPQALEDNLESSHPPTWAWIAGGIGAAGVVTASVFWYVREKAINDLNEGCYANSNICPLSLKATQSRGETASVGAPIALGVGVVGIGIAAYGFLAPRHNKPNTASGSGKQLHVNVDYGSHFAGVNVTGAF